MDLLPPLPLLGAFVVASLVLAATPGPGVLYIVARSVGQGRTSALASVAGVAFGNLGNAIGASLGLAALFALSSTAFTVVRLAGAAYLVWIGIRTLLGPVGSGAGAPPAPASPRRVFADGFVVALLNPKTTLFFAAFLPQFLGATDAPMPRSVALGIVFVAIAAVTDTLYALAASALAPRLSGPKAASIGRWASGSTFIALGVLAAAGSGSRGAGR